MNPDHPKAQAARPAGSAPCFGKLPTTTHSPQSRASRVWRAAALGVLVLTLLGWTTSARADATVTTNTPQALAAAIAQGGLVTFAQDGTITFTNTMVITNQVQLDATGHNVILNGKNAVRLFTVTTAKGNLTLNGLTLTGGRSTNGGALLVDYRATAALNNCTLSGNAAGPLLTNAPNRGQTNSVVLTNGFSLLVTTNSIITNLTFDPFSPFLITNTFIITQTFLQTNNIFGTTIITPANTQNVTNTSTSTNSVLFTNTITSTNITLVTNAFSTILGTNTVVDTTTMVETNFSYVTNLVIPAGHTVAAPGSDGRAGSDSSYGRGGSGGKGQPGAVGLGGAIYNRGNLSLSYCLLVTNSATGGSGGNGGDGGNGSFRGGSGGSGGKGNNGFGGAVYNDLAGQLTIQNCAFDHNTATSGSGGAGGAAGSGAPNGLAGNGGAAGLAYGGALYNLGKAVSRASTFSANGAAGGDSAAAGTSGNGNGNSGARGGDAFGGAVYNGGLLALTNCTLYANAVVGGNGGDGGPGQSRAGRGGNGGTGAGGALFSAKTTFLVNCTLWQNSAVGGSNGLAGSGAFSSSAGSPGAVHGGNLARSAGKLFLVNSIIGASGAGRDAYGTMTDGGYNIWSDKSATLRKHSGSINGVDPGLGSFGAFGGPTPTISLSSNSPALNFIPLTNQVVATDQRGVSRPQDSGFDAGAVEETLEPLVMFSPQSLVQTNGGSATFGVGVAGAGVTYQWRLGATNIDKATNATYTIPSVTPVNAGLYDVVISNQFGCLTSAPMASLTVVVIPPAITIPPTNRMVLPGGVAGFAVGVVGSLPLSYQWLFNGTNLPDATSSLLVLTNVSSANVGAYTVVVTNLFGATTSTPPAMLSLGQLPTITTPPAAQVVPLGGKAVFTVAAQGTTPLLYQWRLNGTNLPGACGINLTSYTVLHAQTNDAGPYTVLVSNLFGTVCSAPANLTVLTGPVITTQPASRTVLVGSNVTFQVTANGSQPLSYQWFYNQTPIPNETTPTYVCNNVQTTNSGSYEVMVYNSFGTNYSRSAVLMVVVPVTLSGRLTDYHTGAGLGGVTLMVTNQTEVQSTNTDAAGYYVFPHLWPASTNTVFPVPGCQLFQPPFANVYLAAMSNSVDFVGRTNNGFSIQGQITNGPGVVSGVSVLLTNASGTQTCLSEAGGFYGFSSLCPGTYQLIPSAPGYQFVPASLSVSVGPDTNNVNFSAIPVFSVTGRIVDGASGAGLAGATVYFNTTNAVQTDANGYFTQTNLVAGNYTLTPELACYHFAPAATLLTVGPAGPNTATFVATNESYQLGGWFDAGTNTLLQFTLKLVGPNRTNYLTLTNGFYVFTNLCPGAYTVEPQPLGCYQFDPPIRSKTLGPDYSSLNFSVLAAPGSLNASGRITLLATNPLSGVTVATVGTNSAAATTTDATGAFHLLALCPGTYEMVPSLAGYRFSPASRRVSVGADTNGLDFAALPVLSLSSTSGGPARISFPTLPGLTYTLVASTNLSDWLTVFSTNVDYTNLASSIVFSDPGSTQCPARYYRLGDSPSASSNSPAVQPLPAVAR